MARFSRGRRAAAAPGAGAPGGAAAGGGAPFAAGRGAVQRAGAREAAAAAARAAPRRTRVLDERQSELLERMRGRGLADAAQDDAAGRLFTALLPAQLQHLCMGFAAEENRRTVVACGTAIVLMLSYWQMRAIE